MRTIEMDGAAGTSARGGDGRGPMTRERLAGLDGLRGAAVLAVIVFHAWPQALPGGFVGVDVFFVLSGFLITRDLLRRPATVTALVTFWRRRARRILPPLLLLLPVVEQADAAGAPVVRAAP